MQSKDAGNKKYRKSTKKLIEEFPVLISDFLESEEDCASCIKLLEKKNIPFVIFDVVYLRKWKGVYIRERAYVVYRKLEKTDNSYDFKRSAHLRKHKYLEIKLVRISE